MKKNQDDEEIPEWKEINLYMKSIKKISRSIVPSRGEKNYTVTDDLMEKHIEVSSISFFFLFRCPILFHNVLINNFF